MPLNTQLLAAETPRRPLSSQILRAGRLCRPCPRDLVSSQTRAWGTSEAPSSTCQGNHLTWWDENLCNTEQATGSRPMEAKSLPLWSFSLPPSSESTCCCLGFVFRCWRWNSGPPQAHLLSICSTMNKPDWLCPLCVLTEPFVLLLTLSLSLASTLLMREGYRQPNSSSVTGASPFTPL